MFLFWFASSKTFLLKSSCRRQFQRTTPTGVKIRTKRIAQSPSSERRTMSTRLPLTHTEKQNCSDLFFFWSLLAHFHIIRHCQIPLLRFPFFPLSLLQWRSPLRRRRVACGGRRGRRGRRGGGVGALRGAARVAQPRAGVRPERRLVLAAVRSLREGEGRPRRRQGCVLRRLTLTLLRLAAQFVRSRLVSTNGVGHIRAKPLLPLVRRQLILPRETRGRRLCVVRVVAGLRVRVGVSVWGSRGVGPLLRRLRVRGLRAQWGVAEAVVFVRQPELIAHLTTLTPNFSPQLMEEFAGLVTAVRGLHVTRRKVFCGSCVATLYHHRGQRTERIFREAPNRLKCGTIVNILLTERHSKHTTG